MSSKGEKIPICMAINRRSQTRAKAKGSLMLITQKRKIAIFYEKGRIFRAAPAVLAAELLERYRLE